MTVNEITPEMIEAGIARKAASNIGGFLYGKRHVIRDHEEEAKRKGPVVLWELKSDDYAAGHEAMLAEIARIEMRQLLTAALAAAPAPQPVAEPVAYIPSSVIEDLRDGFSGLIAVSSTKEPDHRPECTVPLYTAPQPVADLDVIEMVENCTLTSRVSEYAGLADHAAFEAGQDNAVECIVKMLRSALVSAPPSEIDRQHALVSVHNDETGECDGVVVETPALRKLRERVTEFDRMKAENERLKRLFDKQWERTREAGELWRQAHPGNDLVNPDLGELVKWLMDRATTAEARIAELEASEKRMREALEPAREIVLSAISRMRAAHVDCLDLTTKGEAFLRSIAALAKEGE